VMAAPWLLSLGSYAALESWAPGELSSETWEWFSTFVFVIATAVCVCLVSFGRLPRSAKVGVSIFLSLGGLYLAAMFHVHSNCGERPSHIGQKPAEVVASCA